jgi:hypothetical protein
LEQIGSLTQRIRDYERQLEMISEEHYPESELLRQVEGIGTLTALTFLLTLEDPYRFAKSRAVGAYLGLVPARDQSGDRDPQRRISKEGDEMLRKLLVGSAHYILGPFGSDSDLRRHGEKIASRGGKNAKKRAAVAVARKLAAAFAPPVDKRRGLRSSLQHPSAPKAAAAAGGSLGRETREHRERSRRGGEEYWQKRRGDPKVADSHGSLVA